MKKSDRVTEIVGRRTGARDERPERAGYRPREIARLYGLAPSTVYAAIYSGQLKAHRVGAAGRAVVVPVESLEEWLAGEAA